MLNFFDGGPLGGNAYETQQLLSDHRIAAYITQYQWTPDFVTGPQTGAEARVWRHESQPAAPQPAEEPPPVVPQPAEEAVTEMTDAIITEERKNAAQRRKALKLSREDFAKQAGIKTTQVERYERHDKGYNVKQELVDAIESTLSRLEAEQGPSAAQPAVEVGPPIPPPANFSNGGTVTGEGAALSEEASNPL